MHVLCTPLSSFRLFRCTTRPHVTAHRTGQVLYTHHDRRSFSTLNNISTSIPPLLRLVYFVFFLVFRNEPTAPHVFWIIAYRRWVNTLSNWCQYGFYCYWPTGYLRSNFLPSVVARSWANPDFGMADERRRRSMVDERRRRSMVDERRRGPRSSISIPGSRENMW